MSRAKEKPEGAPRYAMTIDLDKCTGCGACMVACAVENNVPPAQSGANDRNGTTLMRVYAMNNKQAYPHAKQVFVPMTCQQCEDPPCETVCPQNAVEYDWTTGIVAQIPVRCLGCRYCMVACPYHARAFNWWDPTWPEGMEATLNPDISTRSRGTAEKCNFCHHRRQLARERTAHEDREMREDEYQPACVEACPVGAITFGNLEDPNSAVSKGFAKPEAFAFVEKLGTKPKIRYLSSQKWVHDMARSGVPGKEATNG